MARKRFVTTDMSGDAKILAVAEESTAAALMWPWFCSALDDWARMNAHPVEISLTVFQAVRAIKPEQIQQAMELYEKHGLAHVYTVDGHQYLQANPKAFYKLNSYIQRSRQEKDGSKYPPPPDHPWAQYWLSRDDSNTE